MITTTTNVQFQAEARGPLLWCRRLRHLPFRLLAESPQNSWALPRILDLARKLCVMCSSAGMRKTLAAPKTLPEGKCDQERRRGQWWQRCQSFTAHTTCRPLGGKVKADGVSLPSRATVSVRLTWVHCIPGALALRLAAAISSNKQVARQSLKP